MRQAETGETQFTLATVTREARMQQQPKLRGLEGDGTDAGPTMSSASTQPKTQTSPKLVAPHNLAKLLAPQSAAAAARAARAAAALPVAVRPVRPAGRWLRQVAGTGRAYELSEAERRALAEALGAAGANHSAQVFSRFTNIPPWLTATLGAPEQLGWANGGSSPNGQSRASSAEEASLAAAAAFSASELELLGGRGVPCLFSEATGRNVFLVAAATSEWEALQAGPAADLLGELLAGRRRCPLPRAGQRGGGAAGSGWSQAAAAAAAATEVSFIIPMHDHVSITLECLLNLLRFADEIPSAEYVLVDDGSLEVGVRHGQGMRCHPPPGFRHGLSGTPTSCRGGRLAGRKILCPPLSLSSHFWFPQLEWS